METTRLHDLEFSDQEKLKTIRIQNSHKENIIDTKRTT